MAFNLTPKAFVNTSGELFIETPCGNTFTVYPSVEHYNSRLCVPTLQKTDTVNTGSMVPVTIDFKTLTIQ